MFNRLIRSTGPMATFYFVTALAITLIMATHPLDTCLTFSPEHIGHVVTFLLHGSFFSLRIFLILSLGLTMVLGFRVWSSVAALHCRWKNRSKIIAA